MLKYLPSPLKIKLRLPLSQLIFSKPSKVISTRSLAPLFQMRQTSLGQTLETSGTAKENEKNVNKNIQETKGTGSLNSSRSYIPDTGLLIVIPEEVRYRSSLALRTISLGTKSTNFKLKMNMKRKKTLEFRLKDVK